MEEKKEKNYYWIIPVVIGIFLLIGLGVFVFIWSIFFGVNNILKDTSKHIQGDWICNSNIKINIDDRNINYSTLYSSTIYKYTYRVNSYKLNNYSQEYELKVSSGNETVNFKITKDKRYANQMTLINTKNYKVYNCTKNNY